MYDKDLKQIPLTALFIALGITFPQFFHLLGLGSGFLPMFIPLMLGSMFLSWQFVIMMGLACPVISWLLTGMPPIMPPILPVLIIELIAAGIIISLLRNLTQIPAVFILVLGIVVDRVVLMLLILLIAPLLQIDHPIFTIGLVLVGIPGIILQLLIIPYAVYLIEKRYPHWQPGMKGT